MTPALHSISRRLPRICALLVLLPAIGPAHCRPLPRVECWLEAAAYRARITTRGLEYYNKGAANPDLIYSLDRITQAGRSIALTSRPTLAKSANVAALDYGSVVTESYTALDQGVEQCWVIHRRPRSSEDVTIEGKVISPHRIVSSPFGLDFVDERGRRVCGYGKVIVIDSRGRTHSCLPRFDSGKVTIRIPSDYIRKASFPILVDPMVGPEVSICPSYESAPGRQESVRVASSPYGYLAVWQDYRGGTADIFATRISPSGEVLDQAAIAVAASTGDQTNPVAAWNGREYLVVWADRRSGNPHIYASRVTLNGEVLDKQGMLLSATTGVQDYPRVASDGANWYVVWQDTRSGSNDIYGCKVSSDGVPAKTNGISTRADNEETPDVAWNGSYYLVVWTDYRNMAGSNTDIYGCRVTRTGIKTGADVIISCTATGTAGFAEEQKWPRVCSFGSNWMAVWEDCRNTAGAYSDVYGARVGPTGAVTDKGGISVCQTPGDQELPCIAYNGTQMLCTWRNRDGDDFVLKAARVYTTGGVLDPEGFAVSSGRAGATGACVVGASHAFFVVWSSFEPITGDAVCSFVLDNGSVTNPAGVVASLGLSDQKDYSVAFNGSEYAVVWSQTVAGGRDILGARISSTGQLLTPTPVNLTAAFAGDQVQPSIAWNGSYYLLAWSGDEAFPSTGWDIRGLRLNSSLGSVDPSPISICAASIDQSRPYVTSGGGKFLVVWEDFRNAVSPYYYSDIYGAQVTSQGTVTVVSPVISSATGHQKRPAAASDGSGFLVVWEDYRSGSPMIYGARVSSAGQTQDTSGIAMPATYYYQYSPQVCWGGSAYLVAWSDSYKISGCRVGQTGMILDPAGIAIDAYSSSKAYPAVCWDGSKYQCVWEDYRSSFVGNSDVYHTTISSSGVVSTSSTVALASDLNLQLNPKVFAVGSAGMLFYDRNINYVNCTCACRLSEVPVQEVGSVSEAKMLSPGTPVAVRGKIVTGAFSGFFYVQEMDRSCGIRVLSTVPVSKGDVVDVVGTVSLMDGERVINSGILLPMGVAGSPPRPLGVQGDYVGGGPLNAYTPGITGACGANNLGLLIKTWGKVTATGTGYFTLEIRPGLTIKIISGSLTKPAVGKIVAVTGISTCQVDSGSSTRAMLTREQADIVILK